jgi:hypothetical protein
MLACGHDRESFGKPVCEHLRRCRESSMDYFLWFTGVDSNTEWLCRVCVQERKDGRPVTTASVCEECFEYLRTEIGEEAGVVGKPEIRIPPKPMNSQIQTTRIPSEFGTIQDISPIRLETQSVWLLLAEDGAIHRTDWNRLDVSDPSTGKSLTERPLTSYRQGEERPAHDLDYFHGALHVSPNDIHILDDGWVWHPVGIPTSWELRPWLDGNVWESEDGPTRKQICGRGYYWDQAMVWLDDSRLAIGGLGDDDEYMVAGARIFDLTATEKRTDRLSYDPRQPREVIAFAGPTGLFFSEEGVLFSADETGLSRWDVSQGSRTGHLEGFCPTHHHQGAHELVQVVEGNLVRWKIDCVGQL